MKSLLVMPKQGELPTSPSMSAVAHGIPMASMQDLARGMLLKKHETTRVAFVEYANVSPLPTVCS